jgi:prepilin-type N-terminal cleavage/methylation domain-containing protein
MNGAAMSRRENRRSAEPPSRTAGFTLVEMLVTLAVFSVVLLAVLALFDSNTRLARAQVRTTDMQQSLRFAQYDMVRRIRMAARGGLPAMLPAGGVFGGKLLPKGVGIEVADNVPANTKIGGFAQAAVLPGTDVVTVRGVFSTLYQSNPVPAGNFTLFDGNNDGLPERGTLILHNTSPTGVPQDLKALADAVDSTKGGQPEALLLVSPLSDEVYAVVELAPTSDYTKASGSVIQVRLDFNVTGTARSLAYLGLSPNGTYPQAMSTVAYAGLLEEHKYYVREVHAVAGDATSDLMPRLSRARVYPGTDAAWKGDTANLVVDVADGVLDLQASLGIDTNGDGTVSEGANPAAKKSDEWLFNQPGDDAGSASWNGGAAGAARLCFLRITTLARTERRDANQYQSPPLGILEDKDYADPAYAKYNSADERRYRYQTLQTSIELRNLS